MGRTSTSFKKGAKPGPGAPKGKHLKTILTEHLTEKEIKDLIRNAYKMAMAGELQMMKVLIDKLISSPKSVELTGEVDHTIRTTLVERFIADNPPT